MFEGGGGGLISTAGDYLAFASALLAGGTHHGERVLAPHVQRILLDFWTAAYQVIDD